MIRNLKKNKFEYAIVSISIVISLLWSIYSLNNFDKTKINFNGNWYNQLLYEDLAHNWKSADKFKKKLDRGDGFFNSIPVYEKFLLPNIFVGYYYHLIDQDIYEKKDNGQKVIKIRNYKFGLLIFQIIIFYLSILLFAKELKKKVNGNLFKFIIFFLSLEPSILQWHSSFWTESLFLSMMLILFSLLLKKSNGILINLIVGVLIGFMFMQRSVSFLYIVPVFIYYVLIYKKKIKPYFFFITGFLLIVLFTGYNNYKKTNYFHILSLPHQYYSFYHYFAHEIYADRKNISSKEAKKILTDEEKKWIENNNIDLYEVEDYAKNVDYRNKIFIREALMNPIYLFTKFIKKITVMCIIHPLWVHQSYYVDKTDPEAINNPKKYYHKHILKNVIYSIFIYFFTFFGILEFLKKIFSKSKLNDFDIFLFFNTVSIFYFIGISGLWGNPKYFAPCMISVIFFFSMGVERVKKFFEKKI